MTKEELEKENVELKEKLRLSDLENHYCLPWCSKLTKAKEIIKYLCGMVRELNKPNVQLTDVDYSLSETEQFLSEVEQ